MEEEVHEHYSSLAAGDEVEDNPEIGLACVLRFDGDGKFYRAERLPVDSAPKCQTFIRHQTSVVSAPTFGRFGTL